MANIKMPSTKDKKLKNKLLKIDVDSTDSDESEHELSYYVKDKVKLMKEVLKLIKPKKIKSMAPDCIKNLDVVEMNSMLLEELLGISNKRLQYIFNGENVDRETSSSDSEEEKQPVDVISLDDISDDDDIELCISEKERSSLEEGAKKNKKHKKSHKIKTEPSTVTIKSEQSKRDDKKSKRSNDPKKLEDLKEEDKEKLMSVLELLELQARARAIRSQLAIENDQKTSEAGKDAPIKIEEDSDSDAVIIETVENKQIVINSSDSEGEQKAVTENVTNTDDTMPPQKKTKVNDDNVSTDSFEVDVSSESLICDLTNLNKSNKDTKSEHERKRQRLLKKIQKVRLYRNQAKANSTKDISEAENNKNDNDATEKSTSSKETNECDIVSTSTDMAVEVPNTEATTTETQLDNNSDNIKTETENGQDTNREDDVKRTTNDAIPLSNQVPKDPLFHAKESAGTSYCDNDEIVINLDEDELDEIEND